MAPTPEPTSEPTQETESLEDLVLPELSPEPKEPEPLPWRVEGEGNEFTLIREETTNIIKSSAKIRGLFESGLGDIVLNFQAIDGSEAFVITITGLVPNHIYHLYTDDLHNHREITADSKGQLIFTQDVSTHHLLMIQPLASTKFIKDNSTGGNCTLIGS